MHHAVKQMNRILRALIRNKILGVSAAYFQATVPVKLRESDLRTVGATFESRKKGLRNIHNGRRLYTNEMDNTVMSGWTPQVPAELLSSSDALRPAASAIILRFRD
ncbi:hypothetical protein OUZ56_004943 [Daphnia magna]|uniref:Uncharacterized protein n=1 Tax=Daphnia magna TaxID=35525 RepID=A0ABQ9YRJ7_9CRUS|nr:hypothetical protein OUZ56_004943 [Daphnia magna]